MYLRTFIWIIAFLVMTALVLLGVLSFPVDAQEQSLPDAPSTVCATTVGCDQGITDGFGNFYKYGNYLSECLDPKTTSVTLLTLGACEKQIQVKKASTPFFKRRRWLDPDLRTNREILTSKVFVIGHAVAALATIADVEVTHQGLGHKGCVESNLDFGFQQKPSRSEMYLDHGVVFAALTGYDFLMDKYVWRPLSLMSPTYQTFVHVRGIRSWVRSGCL